MTLPVPICGMGADLQRRDPIGERRAVDARPPSDLARELSAKGPRGCVRFLLRRVGPGLYVEREDRPSRGIHSVQSMLFTGAGDFEAWCQGDPIRFEFPILIVGLRRESAALWSHGHASAVDRAG